LPPAPEYRLAGQLNPPPRPLGDIDPAYPEQAQGREGSVVLRLLIGANGEIENVAVVRAMPAGVFDASALAAFGAAKFSPGYLNGIAVKSQLTIEVAYTPINRGGGVSGQGR
jgi:protein TonB